MLFKLKSIGAVSAPVKVRQDYIVGVLTRLEEATEAA